MSLAESLYELLDTGYGPDSDDKLRDFCDKHAGTEEPLGPSRETALHVATRRYRTSAVAILIEHGAHLDARTPHGKTAYQHAVRRGFAEPAEVLAQAGANTSLTPADELAVALVHGRFDDAKKLLDQAPQLAHTNNPEEDRLLADLAGRNETAPVALLIEAGAPLDVPGLDDGTPLHQAAWFGQPANARLLIAPGAPLEIFDGTHASSPIGWAVHGSRYSGGAKEREAAYAEVTQLLADAGAQLTYPGDNTETYRMRLENDAAPLVRRILDSIPRS